MRRFLLPRLVCPGMVLFLGAVSAGLLALRAEEVRADEGGAAGGTEEEAEAAAEADTSPLKQADADEAKKLNDALKKAAKRKNANDVLPALEAIDALDSEEFEKILLKLLTHESSLVATRVAEMWEWRVHDKKTAGRLWKAAWQDRSNKSRWIVKAKSLKAFARAGHELDNRQFKEVERTWRWIIGNPIKENAAVLEAIAEYVELVKEKRMTKYLAKELDDPCANVNAADPNAQPADWQERRWWLWKNARPAIVSALQALTGQTFEKTEDARKWIEDNEKTYGFEW
jgi:hypothetical protein